MAYSYELKFKEYDRACKLSESSSRWVDDTVYPFPFTDMSTSSPLRKGDHTTDLPYTCSWREFNRPLDAEQLINCVATRSSLCAAQKDSWTAEGFADYTDVYRWFPRSWVPVPPSPSSDVVRRLKDAATTTALANAKVANVNVGILLAERAATVRMLQRRVRHLCQLATAQGRSSLALWYRSASRDRKRLYNEIASTHLEFLFGVLPLIGEIEGLMGLLDEQPTLRITGRGRRADVEEVFLPPYSGGGGWNSAYRWTASGKMIKRTSVRVSLKYKLSVYNKMSARTLGLNPLAVAYDIIPLSFLSDFISNTGAFIRSMDPTPGMEYDTGCWTLYNQATTNGVVSPGPMTPPWTSYSSSGTAEFGGEAGNMVRTVYPTEPSAVWQFQNNLTLGKAITISALAVQRYVKPLRRVVRQQPFRYKGPRPRNLPPIKYP